MQLAKDSFYTFLGMALPFVVGIVTVPLYVSEIGIERYGALSIAWVLLGYFGQMDFGVGRAITQRISALGGKPSAQSARAIWSALISSALFGFVGGAVVYVGAKYFFSGPFQINESLRGELVGSVWALAICNPLVSLTGVTSGALVGIERFRVVSVGTFISNTGLQVFPLVSAYLFGHDLQILILAALVARLLGVVIFGLAVWTSLLRSQPVVASRSEVRGLTNFGIWIMVSAFVGPLMMFADRFVIGSFLGALSVAAYTIPFQVAYRTQILPLAIAQVLFPRFASESAAQSSVRCGDFTVLIGQLFAPFMIGLISLSGPLLKLWLGTHLDIRSVPVAQILFIGIWMNAVAQIPFSYIQARGNSRFTAALHVFELPIYISLLVGLGLAFGLSGVAAAFTLRCGLDCAVLMIKARVRNRSVMRAVLSQLTILIVAVATGQRIDGWGEAILAATLLCLASLVCLLVQVPDSARERLAALPGARFVPGLARRS